MIFVPRRKNEIWIEIRIIDQLTSFNYRKYDLNSVQIIYFILE